MKLEDVKKLAQMARIDMDEVEMGEIAKDFDPILAYVSQVQEALKLNNIQIHTGSQEDYFLNNVMREDVITNKPGEYTEKILNNTPDTENGFLKVKQIL